MDTPTQGSQRRLGDQGHTVSIIEHKKNRTEMLYQLHEAPGLDRPIKRPQLLATPRKPIYRDLETLHRKPTTLRIFLPTYLAYMRVKEQGNHVGDPRPNASLQAKCQHHYAPLPDQHTAYIPDQASPS